MKRQHLVIIFVFFSGLIILPYIAAWKMSGSEYVFGGMLANPIDGQSYLAKMRLGFDGHYLFHLLYTPQNGSEQPLFLFYIMLGWVARFFGWSLIFTFHLARFVSAVLLFFTLYALVQRSVERPYRTWALLLLTFGSGMGWLILAFSHELPIDFYVAEAYPFLSSYSNPHFPLGITLTVWILIKSVEYRNLKDAFLIFIFGFLLSIILPFGIVLALCIYGGYFVWNLVQKVRISTQPIWSVLLGGGVFLIYQYWVIKNDPLLSLWDSQNITQSPSLLILVLGLLPVLLPACLSGRKFLKSEFNKFQTILFIWIITSLLLTCIPFNLQRRFLTAIYIPVVINAVVYIAGLKKNIRVKNLIFFGLLFLSLISNAIILMMQLNAAENKDPRLYLKLSEANAMLWLEKNSSSEEVVLAPESIGLFIPGWTGQRVVYGHPFESVNGALQQKNISDFYSGKINAQNLRDYLNKNQVFYIWSEKEDSHLWLENLKELFTQVYERDGIILYKVE